MSYFYKTESLKVLAAARAWAEKKAAWDAQREKLAQAFGGAASPMCSGTRNYVSSILDVHWRRPDEYGYRALRTTAKHAKGSAKDVRSTEKAEHQRLLDLWKERCPEDIDRDEMWDAIGVNTGMIWLAGGVCFEHNGAVYLNLGSSANEVDGLVEVVSSEYESARQRVLNQSKAA